jgi:hypothetical protein
MPSVPDPETFTVDPKTGLANYDMSMRCIFMTIGFLVQC